MPSAASRTDGGHRLEPGDDVGDQDQQRVAGQGHHGGPPRQVAPHRGEQGEQGDARQRVDQARRRRDRCHRPAVAECDRGEDRRHDQPERHRHHRQGDVFDDGLRDLVPLLDDPLPSDDGVGRLGDQRCRCRVGTHTVPSAVSMSALESARRMSSRVTTPPKRPSSLITATDEFDDMISSIAAGACSIGLDLADRVEALDLCERRAGGAGRSHIGHLGPPGEASVDRDAQPVRSLDGDGALCLVEVGAGVDHRALVEAESGDGVQGKSSQATVFADEALHEVVRRGRASAHRVSPTARSRRRRSSARCGPQPAAPRRRRA